jgi:hypothetical protein
MRRDQRWRAWTRSAAMFSAIISRLLRSMKKAGPLQIGGEGSRPVEAVVTVADAIRRAAGWRWPSPLRSSSRCRLLFTSIAPRVIGGPEAQDDGC